METNWLKGEFDSERLVTLSFICFLMKGEFTVGDHRKNNKQDIFVYIYILNRESIRKFSSALGLPEFCTASLYFIFSASFLSYVPLSLQTRVCFTVNHPVLHQVRLMFVVTTPSFFLLTTT